MIVEGGLLGFGARGEQEALLRHKVCVFILNALSFSFSKSVFPAAVHCIPLSDEVLEPLRMMFSDIDIAW